MRHPAYDVATFIGLCALLYLGIGGAFTSWHSLPRLLLMIAGFSQANIDACFDIVSPWHQDFPKVPVSDVTHILE